ncbi:metallophosphoesterase [Streptomyces seoulensis]|uniref:Metallophosphoesterase n=1 Tax=Streptomyces seoulensis TaxID=73044 RepID=A0A4V0ZZR2_STRSO|nr:metallophosphoesterase [Streptomyces seoulensis]QBJ91976.1 metallophosphoesterase [Streptomyces seoulensis]
MVIVFALVALAVLALVAGLHWYVWRRLVRDTTRPRGAARRAGTVLFVAAPVLMIAALVAERSGAPFWLQRALAWPGFLWMALALYLLLATLATEPVRVWAGRRARRATREAVFAGLDGVRTPPAERAAGEGFATPAKSVRAEQAPASPAEPSVRADAASAAPREPSAGADGTSPAEGPQATALAASALSRRVFVSRVAGGTAAAVALGTTGWGTYGVLRGPRVKRLTVPLAKLPRSAHGFRIAVVSDIHLGPVLGRDFARTVVDTINSTQPDMIAVVGDLVDGSVKNLGPAAAPLAGLESRLGTYFVTGNHEYFSGAAQWLDEVRTLGMRPLENARTELPYFDLAGVNDLQGESEGHGPDFRKALGDRDPARACVLMAHQPVQVHEAVRYDVDLQLSGHTHGGQLWPGNLIAKAANPTVAGLDRYGDTQLYVSRGAGAWGPPTRVWAPSDITVIELASREA